MTNNLPTNPQSVFERFQDSVKDKMADLVADSLPDEVLTEMVQRAVEEMLFSDRITHTNKYGSERKIDPSWFKDEVMKIAKPLIEQTVREKIEAHESDIEQAIADMIIGNEMMARFTNALAERLDKSFQDGIQEIRSAIMYR